MLAWRFRCRHVMMSSGRTVLFFIPLPIACYGNAVELAVLCRPVASFVGIFIALVNMRATLPDGSQVGKPFDYP
jgi:hypothetical protein